MIGGRIYTVSMNIFIWVHDGFLDVLSILLLGEAGSSLLVRMFSLRPLAQIFDRRTKALAANFRTWASASLALV